METEFKKVNFVQKIIYAVAKPTEYDKLSRESMGRVIGFVFLLMLITTMIGKVFPIAKFYLEHGGFKAAIEEYVPDFELKDGKLKTEAFYNIDSPNEGVLCYVDTDVTEFSMDDVDRTTYYDTIILISNKNLIVYSGGSLQELKFSDLSELELSRESLFRIIPYIYIALIMIFIVIYLFSVALYFITALIYSLIGLIINSIININLDYKTLFCIAIYSKVTMSLLSEIVIAFGQKIPLKPLFSIIVSCIYMCIALKEIKNKNESNRNESQLNYFENEKNPNNKYYR